MTYKKESYYFYLWYGVNFEKLQVTVDVGKGTGVQRQSSKDGVKVCTRES